MDHFVSTARKKGGLRSAVKASIGTCRLLYLVGQLGCGGLERQLCYLLRLLDRERYRPAVVIWNASPSDIYADEVAALGVPMYSFPRQATALEKLCACRSLVKRLDPEVLHSYSFYTNFAASYAALGRRAVSIGSVRSNFILDKTDAGPWLGRLSACFPRCQISNSMTAAETARRSRSLFRPRRLSVVRNGLDLELFRRMPLPWNEVPRILSIGSLLPIKRWDRLLATAHELKRRKHQFLFQIAGDGPMRRSLQQQALDLGLADHVEFLGATDDIPKLLADAVFLVHTSDAEGCPNVVMEAMAAGRPVVATDAGDVPYLVEDGISGFVVRRGDDDALADRIATLLIDRDRCRQMGDQARAKAEREFDVRSLITGTLAAYRAAGWRDE